MIKIYLGFIRGIGYLENTICYTALLASTLLITFQVINRYVLHYPIMWMGDLALYLYVPAMIFSIALTTREQSHTAMEILQDGLFKPNSHALTMFKIFVNVVVLAVLFYLLPMTLRLFQTAIKYPEFGTLVTWFNTSWIRQSLLIMNILCIIHTLHHIGLLTLDLIGLRKPQNGANA